MKHPWSVFVVLLVAAGVLSNRSRAADRPAIKKPVIKKLGTIDCDLVETTPIVFNGKLYRFEYVRERYKPNTTGDSYFRFVDVQTGAYTPAFAEGYHLGSAFVEGNTVYVYGVPHWGKPTIEVFWSKDLKKWSRKTALKTTDWGIYNTAVCKAGDRTIMAIEIGEPPEETGTRFTIRFAESNDLLAWKILPGDHVYSKKKYTACPAIRYLDGMYYMIYLASVPGAWEPHIVRSKDLRVWEPSPLNPIMRHGPEDKRIANPKLTDQQREHIAKAVNRNNSDVDLCTFGGKTVIYYSWGDQHGTEFLAEAVYEGTEESFLKGFFPAER